MSDNLFLADNQTPHVEDAEGVEPEWHTAEAGFQLEPAEIAVSQEHQASKLAACGIEAQVFGPAADPAFFIGIGIQAGIRSGISAQGNINMVQKLTVYRPANLGEVLLVRGEIEAVDEVPRGHQVTTKITFEDKSGTVIIDASRTSLRPDPAKAGARGAGVRPPPVVDDTKNTIELAAHKLTPPQVKDYSIEGNSIHYEEEAAKAAGFRAPMIGGGMGVHYLTAALFERSVPKALDMSIYFRRPIFWDEQFTSACVAEGSAGHAELPQLNQWRALCLLRDEGDKGLKVLTEARLNGLRT